LEDIAQNVEALFINIDWGKKGQTIQDFEKLKIDSTKFMSKGIAFVWAPKELVTEIL
jgi:GH43 family beta-xylosidase